MAVVYWTGGTSAGDPASGAFSAPQNWSTGMLPGANDDAVLGSGSYTVEINGYYNVNTQSYSYSVHSLEIDKGAILQVGPSGNNFPSLRAENITSSGTILDDTMSTSRTDYYSIIANNQFNNTGLVQVQNGALLHINGFTNNGSVVVTSDSSLQLVLSASDPVNQVGALSGKWAAQQGSSININAGTHLIGSLGADAVVTLADGGIISSATYQPNQSATLYQSLTKIDSGAVLNLTGSQSVAFSNALTIGGVLHVDGGTILSAPDLDVVAGGSIALHGELDAAVSIETGGLLKTDHQSTLGGDLMIAGVLKGSGQTTISQTAELAAGGKVALDHLILTGTLTADAGDEAIKGKVTGTGMIDLAANSHLTLNGHVANGITLSFDGDDAQLRLADPAHFNGLIDFAGTNGSSAGQTIDLLGFDPSGLKEHWTEDADGMGGVLHIKDNGHSVGLHIAGTYTSADFSVTADSSGHGTLVNLYHSSSDMIIS